MAKKTTTGNSKKMVSTAPARAAAPARVTSEVRNTTVPPVRKATAPKAITQEMIAVRAFEIWSSGKGGSEVENWSRAERELRGV